MDGLGKAADMLQMPKRALWAMMPGITSGDLADMEALHEQEKTDEMFNPQTPSTARERRPVRAGDSSGNES